METTGHDLRKHDDWAGQAVLLVEQMSAAQKHNLLMHVFRSVAHHQLTTNPQVAIDLCRDLHSTIDLHSDPVYAESAGAAVPPDRENSVSIDEALTRLASL